MLYIKKVHLWKFNLKRSVWLWGESMVSYARQRHFRCKQSPNSQFCTLFSQKSQFLFPVQLPLFHSKRSVFSPQLADEHGTWSSWKITNHEKVKNTVPTPPRQHWICSPRQDKKESKISFSFTKMAKPYNLGYIVYVKKPAQFTCVTKIVCV